MNSMIKYLEANHSTSFPVPMAQCILIIYFKGGLPVLGKLFKFGQRHSRNSPALQPLARQVVILTCNADREKELMKPKYFQSYLLSPWCFYQGVDFPIHILSSPFERKVGYPYNNFSNRLSVLISIQIINIFNVCLRTGGLVGFKAIFLIGLNWENERGSRKLS